MSTAVEKEGKILDQLRVEGVNYKGFGILPNYAMHDPDLTVEAKAIYAYLCSFAGNGNSAFPSRNKILSDLNLSKDTYYKHFSKITEQGYIKVEQDNRGGRGNGYLKNKYIIVSNPKKFDEKPQENHLAPTFSIIRFSGLKAAGYGMIPKAVMLDDRLSIKAKAIYAYFCTYTGSGNTAFPKKEHLLYHLQITERTYYKLYKKLKELNYISIVQRHISGRLSVNDYYLNDMPDIAKSTKKTVSVVDKQDTQKQDTQKQDTQKQDTQKQDTQKQDINNNSIKKNKYKYNQSINKQTPQLELSPILNLDGLIDNTNKEVEEEIDDIGEIPSDYRRDAKKMDIALKHFANPDKMFAANKSIFQKDTLALILDSLVEMSCAHGLQNYKGCYVTGHEVVEKLNDCIRRDCWLDEFFDVTINDYISGANKSEIRDPKKYAKAVIWSSLSTYKIKSDSSIARNDRECAS